MKISLGYALLAMLLFATAGGFGLFFGIEMWGYVPTIEGKLEWAAFVILYLTFTLGIPAMVVGAAIETIRDAIDEAEQERFRK